MVIIRLMSFVLIITLNGFLDVRAYIGMSSGSSCNWAELSVTVLSVALRVRRLEDLKY
jgi:hypothetical protein